MPMAVGVQGYSIADAIPTLQGKPVCVRGLAKRNDIDLRMSNGFAALLMIAGLKPVKLAKDKCQMVITGVIKAVQ